MRLLKGAPRHPCRTPSVLGILLPHAGWICSGEVAAEGVAHAAENASPDLCVVFGAVHTSMDCSGGLLDAHDAWSLPTGEIPLPRQLQEELAGECSLLQIEPRLHEREHSIEVDLPFLQIALPDVPVLPIEVAPDGRAVEVGRQTARALRQKGRHPIFFASSDLTHYGRNYGLAPAGAGNAAMQWAMNNDRRLLTLIEELRADEIVAEAHAHLNACGAGAIAAMLGAAMELGARQTQLLRHTSSHETLSRLERQAGDVSVGYAALAVG